MNKFRMAAAAAAGVITSLMAWTHAAVAQVQGAPHPWQINFQAPATPIMEELVGFHTFLTWLVTAIAVFVLGLLIYIVWRFNAKANPVPSKNQHNTVLEVIWTVIPVAILVIMAIPSFRLLYRMDVVPDAARVKEMYGITVAGTMDIKAIGHQWNWSYEYPRERIQFDAFCAIGPIEGGCFEQTPSPTRPRLLDTTDPGTMGPGHVMVPVNTLVRMLVTGTDVIHSWAVPAFGVKMDAVPGRINETWFLATKEGLYFGQCSELCGQGHGFMPITVEVVSKQRYDQWVTSKRAELGVRDDNVRFAAN